MDGRTKVWVNLVKSFHMAKQMGAHPLTGPMGGVSYYKSEGEYRAREKSGPTRRTVLTSPRFTRTRENFTEFRHAVRSGMLVRHSLGSLIRNLKLADSGVSGRLNALFVKIIRSDSVNDRGKRKATPGDLEMLEGFEFHKGYTLSKIASLSPVTSINTATGALQTTIRPFDPEERIHAPLGATHFKIVSAAAAIDFDKEQWIDHHRETGYLPLDTSITEVIRLEHVLQAESGQSLLLTMGIIFYAAVEEGKYQRVSGGGMKLLQVSKMEARAAVINTEQNASVTITTKPPKQVIKKTVRVLKPFTRVPITTSPGNNTKKYIPKKERHLIAQPDPPG